MHSLNALFTGGLKHSKMEMRALKDGPHSGYPCKAVILRKIAKVEELVNDKYICKMGSILSFGDPNFLLYHSYGNVWVIIYQFLHLCNLSWGDSFARTSQAGVIFQCSHPHLRML